MFSNCPGRTEPKEPVADETRHFHATTLHQCQLILKNGFIVGLHHKGTQSSPCGIWGCDSPGHAYDRCHLARGWSISDAANPSGYSGYRTGTRELGVSGWDVPVALCWIEQRSDLRVHVRLKTANVLSRNARCGDIIDVRSRETEIWIHRDMYARFNKLKDVWQDLKASRVAVCRARLGCPRDLYDAGHASPMTCGRVCRADACVGLGWQKANKTQQWRCPACDKLYSSGLPCTDEYVLS